MNHPSLKTLVATIWPNLGFLKTPLFRDHQKQGVFSDYKHPWYFGTKFTAPFSIYLTEKQPSKIILSASTMSSKSSKTQDEMAFMPRKRQPLEGTIAISASLPGIPCGDSPFTIHGNHRLDNAKFGALMQLRVCRDWWCLHMGSVSDLAKTISI